MTLLSSTYGKGRVRVMRLAGEGDHRDVRELEIRAMLTGDIDRAFTEADNSTTVSTDTIKNVVNIVAREELELGAELFCRAVARRLLDSYPGMRSATVSARETRWSRLAFDGTPQPHAFTRDGNGFGTAEAVTDRSGGRMSSGLSGFTFLKATASGWANYLKDPYTTIPETHDRIAATAMEARWAWERDPADFAEANGRVLDAMLRVFATTYSHSVQDSLYRMGEAALAAVPELDTISLACPNKHYLPVNLAPFGLDNPNRVFVATDEPHGQIECTIGR
ncbi:factor-independent urate hydroxylase [Lichenibacterium dinghuense]|uniref:factor-independent urate hydroxylase n=1 Tax=Lichenibacterium dinghuense TaxID=2895977 RepID=UPI001F00B532|nr:urate oxidase [Lichenibacterium sp. 6Y81]